MKLLETGRRGARVDRLALELELESISMPIIKSAIEKLIKEKLVTEIKPSTYVPTSSLKAKRKTYEILIEKILPSAAIVLVDNTLRAILTPTEYKGPRSLIKKNVKFRALAQLYKLEGTLYIRVNEVTEIL